MWIEIVLLESEYVKTPLYGVYNFYSVDLIEKIAPCTLRVWNRSIVHTIRLFSPETCDAIYQGFLLALQGQETKFEGIGHIKPLLNEKREQLHKYLLYKETLNSLTSDIG